MKINSNDIITSTKEKITSRCLGEAVFTGAFRVRIVPDAKHITTESNQAKFIKYFLSNEFTEVTKHINYSLTISDLEDSQYELTKPIKVEIEYLENGELLGTIENLNIYAYNKVESELISEIKNDLLDLYDDIIDNPENELGTNPKKWKEILKQHVKRVK